MAPCVQQQMQDSDTEHSSEPDSSPKIKKPNGCHRKASASFARNSKNGWTTCADYACCFQSSMVDGLCSLSWERIVIRLQFHRANVHVFLVGKESDQQCLEHAYSRECIMHLCDMLLHNRRFPLHSVQSPCWVRSLKAVPVPVVESRGKWSVITEEGIYAVFCYIFDTEIDATYFFDQLGPFITRTLRDPEGMERRSATPNPCARKTIEKAIEKTIAEAKRPCAASSCPRTEIDQ